MNREAALDYLNSRFHRFAIATETPGVDEAVGYKTVIDSALRQLGFPEVELAIADTLKVTDFQQLLRFYAFELFADNLALEVDTSLNSGQINSKDSQMFAQVTRLKVEAEEKCKSLGYEVGSSTGSFKLGRLNLDFLEPPLND